MSFFIFFFFFKQKTAYDMRISDWSSDVCSSDLRRRGRCNLGYQQRHRRTAVGGQCRTGIEAEPADPQQAGANHGIAQVMRRHWLMRPAAPRTDDQRSEEHTSELQSLMRISYAVFCLKKKICKPYL